MHIMYIDVCLNHSLFRTEDSEWKKAVPPAQHTSDITDIFTPSSIVRFKFNHINCPLCKTELNTTKDKPHYE